MKKSKTMKTKLKTDLVSFGKSDCHGNGLIASKDIDKEQVIHTTHVWSKYHKMWVNVKPNCMYNHSKEKENCKVLTSSIDDSGVISKQLVTTKPISKGEELFVDFTKDKDLEQPKPNWKK